MSVWLCIPSARPPDEVEPVLRAWFERGYYVALWRSELTVYANHWMGLTEPYPGYASAVNQLSLSVLSLDHSCDWIVTGGDDTLPDPNHTAEEIAEECSKHFSNWLPDATRPEYHGGTIAYYPHLFQSSKTFGIMQPTGDRFAGGSIDRIAGSPWMGREWCLRANQGKGPLWPEFTHMFGDECLKRTAEKLGVYWMRPDLVHFHKHFMRESDAIDSRAVGRQPPPHLTKWSTPEHWQEMLDIYRRLEREEFTSCLPL